MQLTSDSENKKQRSSNGPSPPDWPSVALRLRRRHCGSDRGVAVGSKWLRTVELCFDRRRRSGLAPLLIC